MTVQDLIKFLETLPSDTKVTCCEDRGGDYYPSPTEVEATTDHLDYTPSTKNLKIGLF